ncbi:hypothetical protein [Halobacillus sp. K22]|uniref:hypothetical protein n=1 Tax=Halobacillus sp. K22 TaxID=3457431 RepID=UPI003FCCF6E9
MKKTKYLVFVLLLGLLVACSSNSEGKTNEEANSKSEASGSEENETSEESETGESVEVDEGLMNVEVTLPSSMVEGESMDVITEEAKEQGVKKVTKNDNGSVTYKMSKSAHQDLLEEVKAGMEESITETKNDENFASIKDITHNNNFTEFTMIVDRETYENSMDVFATMSLGMSGMMYQVFEGKNEDEYSVTINIEDESSGETIDEVVYPDALENMETEAE